MNRKNIRRGIMISLLFCVATGAAEASDTCVWQKDWASASQAHIRDAHYNFGTVRAPGGSDTTAPGEPVSEWVELTNVLTCTAQVSFDVSGFAYSLNTIAVVLDGRSYISPDGVVPPGK